MIRLPSSMRVLERGWLSSNNVVFLEGETATVVDSGYVSHAEQTVALVRRTVDGRRLSRLVNTHSHSDHVGGNRALARAFRCRILVPQGMAAMVEGWDEDALLLAPTDQRGERFDYDETISPGASLEMGGIAWDALPAPGHDMSALVFYSAEKRLLISGDALWRNGFGIIFAALADDPLGFSRTRETLERIGRLAVDIVIPGHGAPFDDVDAALQRAFTRLESFERDGERHARHALRVLFTFALLEKREMPVDTVPAYLGSVPLIAEINDRYFRQSYDDVAGWVIRDLDRSGAVRLEGDRVVAAGGA